MKINICKTRILSKIMPAILLTALFVMAILAVYMTSAKPAVYALSSGTTIDLSDTVTTSGTGWTYSVGTFTINDGADITVTGAGTGRIIVVGTATATIENITLSANGAAAIALNDSAELTLILSGANTVTVTGDAEGIAIGTDAVLTIQGDNESTLTVNGGTNGIGSGDTTAANAKGTVNIIEGAIVTANSGPSVGNLSVGHAIVAGSVNINASLVYANRQGNSGNYYGIFCGSSERFYVQNQSVVFVTSLPMYYADSGGYRVKDCYVSAGSYFRGNLAPAFSFMIPTGMTMTVVGTLTINEGLTLTINGTLNTNNASAKVFILGAYVNNGTITDETKVKVPEYLSIISAVQVGGIHDGTRGWAASTAIEITLSKEVTGDGSSGFTTSKVVITNGTGSVVKSTINLGTDTKAVWTIPLQSVSAGGDVTVNLTDFGQYIITGEPATVTVYRDERISVQRLTFSRVDGEQNKSDTTQIRLLFSGTNSNLLGVNDLKLADITIEDETGEIEATSLTCVSALEYLLDIDVVTAGTVRLSIALSSFKFNETYQMNEYKITMISGGSVTVYKALPAATVTVTAPSSIIYGQALGDPSATASDGGSTFTYNYTGTTYANAAYNSTDKPTQAGEYTVTAALFSETHQGKGTADFTIDKKTLTWSTDGTVNDKDYDGNTSAVVKTHPTLNTGGIIQGDTVSLINGTAAFSGANAGTDIAVVASGYSLTGSDADNYTIEQPVFESANINKFKVTVTPYDGQSKIYGENEPALFNYNMDVEFRPQDSAYSGTIGRENGENAGTYDYTLGTLAFSEAYVANYEFVLDTTNKFEIIKAGQSAPAAPTVSSKTATSITLAVIPGAEYRLDTGAWQSSPEFSGLSPATGYIFYARLAEDGNHNASAESPSSATITTDAATLGGTVTVTGTLQFGQTLTANTDGLSSTPSVTLGALTYQWKRGTANIGTNSSTYVLTQDDIGQTVTVTVTAENCDGSITSQPTAAVAKAEQAAPEAPQDQGINATIIIVIIPIYHPNLFEFRIDGGQWQNNDGIFEGLLPNTEYKFEARYKETATHAASAASAARFYSTDKPALGGSVTISGTAAYGQTLMVNTSGLTSSPAGYAVGAISYQWKRNGTDIVGATDSAYMLVQEDIGQNISVTATAANCSGFVTSSPTAAVIKVNQSAPSLDYSVSESNFPKTITITFVQGAEYRFNDGEWSGTNTYISAEAETVTLSIRYEETDTHFASNISSMPIDTANQNQQAPTAFTLTHTANGDTDYTVTIPKVDGAEYSFDGETWSDENIKTNCIPGSTVTGYMRMAVKPGYNASGATSAAVTLPLFQVAAPSATPDGGVFTGFVSVTLTTATDGAEIYYTLDGTTPDAGSTRYDGAFTLTVSATVKAVAIKGGMLDSDILTLAFEIQELSYIVAVENGTGGGYYVPGVLVTVTANAAADGKEFDKWITDDGVTFANASLSQTTFIMPDKDVTVTALYKDIPTGSRTVTEGNNGTWNQNSDDGFTITVSGDFDAGITVKVDGNVLTNEEYTVAAGSTKVTIKKSYLDALAKGEHTVEILFTDGASISTTLTIGASKPNGLSGGAIAGIVIGSIAALGGAGFAIYWFVIKKKKAAKINK